MLLHRLFYVTFTVTFINRLKITLHFSTLVKWIPSIEYYLVASPENCTIRYTCMQEPAHRLVQI